MTFSTKTLDKPTFDNVLLATANILKATMFVYAVCMTEGPNILIKFIFDNTMQPVLVVSTFNNTGLQTTFGTGVLVTPKFDDALLVTIYIL